MDSDRPGMTLAALREEIDRIDAAMHGLLMERGTIIDRLVATKRTAESGSAFRPDREAAMLRALAERHAGRLPLDAVEGIWRVIISTFTHVQAPFAIHGDAAAGAAAMRDAARYHFGFTVPYQEHDGPAEVIAAVARSRGDLGLVTPDGHRGAWWRALEPEAAPKVIARLPFVERAAHPAGRPLLAVASGRAEAGPNAVALFSVRVAARPDVLPPGAPLDWLAEAEDEAGLAGLVAAPAGWAPEAVVAAIPGAGGGRAVPVGTHPARFRLPG